MLDKCELTTDLSSSPKKQISRWGFKCRGVVWKANPDVTGKMRQEGQAAGGGVIVSTWSSVPLGISLSMCRARTWEALTHSEEARAPTCHLPTIVGAGSSQGRELFCALRAE